MGIPDGAVAVYAAELEYIAVGGIAESIIRHITATLLFSCKIRSYPTKSERVANLQPKLQNVNHKSDDQIMHDLTLREAYSFTAESLYSSSEGKVFTLYSLGILFTDDMLKTHEITLICTQAISTEDFYTKGLK